MTILDAIPYAIAAAIALGAGGYILHCQSVTKDHEQLITQLKADAEAQQRGIAAQRERERLIAEKSDAKLHAVQSDLKLVRQQLRDERTRSSSVPSAPANASRPDLACFDRAEFARAVDNLETGVEDIVGKGAEATVRLALVQEWANEALVLKPATKLETQ